jgi:TonB family protein
VSSRKIRRWVAGSLLGFLCLVEATALVCPLPAYAQEELARKVKTKVAPIYPDIARRMSIAGIVKVAVVVTPGGNVKSTKVVGGHPLLVNAAMDALKKWKFEAAPEESTGVVEFKFGSQN